MFQSSHKLVPSLKVPPNISVVDSQTRRGNEPLLGKFLLGRNLLASSNQSTMRYRQQRAVAERIITRKWRLWGVDGDERLSTSKENIYHSRSHGKTWKDLRRIDPGCPWFCRPPKGHNHCSGLTCLRSSMGRHALSPELVTFPRVSDKSHSYSYWYEEDMRANAMPFGL